MNARAHLLMKEITTDISCRWIFKNKICTVVPYVSYSSSLS